MSNMPTEPAADLRVMASVCWQMFTALRMEGFNEQQALVVIGQMIAASASGQK